MPRTKISEFSATPANNTDIDSINISEGCAPSGINDAIRELMAQLKDFQTGAVGDSFNGPVGTSTAAAGAFTTLSASSTVSGTGFSTYLASPPAIGGTAAAAGAFTTLAASGAVTLSGGTANGVAYLNGSKVVTSGSALTFNGTNTFTVIPTTGTAYNRTESTQYSTWLQTGAGNANVFWEFSAGTPVRWVDTSSGELMRLTSTGLGIGTSSPAAKLHIKGSSNPAIYWENSTFGSATNAAFMGSAGQLIFGRTGVADWLTIDNSGNLGLGVTPTQAFANSRAIQIGSGGLIEGRTNESLTFSLASNAYLSSAGNWTYTTNNRASLFALTNGSYSFGIAAAGTGTITFTEAMILNASGNLGVGTTSPLTKLHVQGTDVAFTANTLFDMAIIENGASGNGSVLQIVAATNGSSEIGFSDTTRNIGKIGYDHNTNVMVFDTNGSERARIDSSGNLLVGTTAANVNSGGHLFIPGADSNYYIGHSGSPSGAIFHAYQYNGTTIGSVTQSGTTAVLYNLTSDQRLKENIQDAESSSNLIDSIQVRKFDWKTDNTHQRYGFIAQELLTVYPEAVHQPNDTEEMMAVDYSKLVPMLVKEIQSLRQRVAQLESN